MSECCVGTAGATPPDSSEACPGCGAKGARVDAITLKALLTGAGLRRGIPAAPRFCATRECPVVYFDGAVRFGEEHLSVRVHAKHPEDDSIAVCYCLDYSAASIRALAALGERTASEDVAHEVKAGRCACEVRNPKGSCCLGDVTKVEAAVTTPAAALAR